MYSTDLDCTDLGEAVTHGDCDDTDPARSPSFDEVAGDDIDNDCSGDHLCYVDDDADGYGSTDTQVVPNYYSCSSTGSATQDGDCATSDSTIHPEGIEAVGDGIDQDCDGYEQCYADLDSDGFGDDLILSLNLTCDGIGESTQAGDCDDTDAASNPDNIEVCWDSRDDDCDGYTTCFLGGGDADGAFESLAGAADDFGWTTVAWDDSLLEGNGALIFGWDGPASHRVDLLSPPFAPVSMISSDTMSPNVGVDDVAKRWRLTALRRWNDAARAEGLVMGTPVPSA